MAEMIFSTTGRKHGSGSDWYRWVSGLSKFEREAVKSGKTVVIDGAPTHGGNLPVRKVTYNKRHKLWDCRCFTNKNEAIAALRLAGYDPDEFLNSMPGS
jgi:hypothetical protein